MTLHHLAFAGMCLAWACSCAAGDEEEPLYLYEVLLETGRRLDCRFTVERIIETPERKSALNAAAEVAKAVNEAADVPALVASLTRTLQGVRVVRDQGCPSVIHLIEAPLEDAPGYALRDTVSLSFDGTPGGLVQRLTKSVPTLRHPRMTFLPAPFEDYETKISVAADKRTVRAVLTDAVPLKGYNRIVWIAETELRGERPETWVRFLGPVETKPDEAEPAE